MISRVAAAVAASAVVLAVAACSEGLSESANDTSSAQSVTGFQPSRAHVMKMHASSPIQPRDTAGPAGAKLKYFGGPVISNVKVYAVYWGSGVQFQDRINAFFPAITDSAYFDWLTEYNTPTQAIGRGSFGGAVVDTSPLPGTNVTDDQIQTEIAKLIDAHTLPANDGSNLYMIYFPPGLKVTGPPGAGTSCVQWCAYHSTFTKTGAFAYYSVVPDQGGACAGGCGSGAPQDNVTQVSSHEMLEAVTDGALAEATTAGPPLAWYDETNGEIGDICVGSAGQVAGFAVQLQWSNRLGLCTALGGGSTGSGN